jgi:UDP-N-acetylglucosamine--N-acetylmuramyl-(pentapeptide) pyrophosphoryl-undecaprenol N-acetylglucosamine transferase
MRMLLAGGGTGGHLFPAVALAEKLMKDEPDAEVLFVGTERGIEARVLPELGWPLKTVDIKGFSGKGLLAKAEVMMKMIKSVKQGKAILKQFAPDIVVGVGGYASAPLVLAAKMQGVPVVLHEQNAIPGLTNRLMGRWAERIFVSFDQTRHAFNNAVVTGNPLRGELENCPETETENLKLLVFGGSRGARAINDTLCDALPGLKGWEGRLTIVHQTGEEDYESVQERYATAGWGDAEISPFINDMASVYRQASLIVCRAGATTIAELTACGRPAILIPFPYAANDHQRANAEALAVKGAALMMDQQDVNGEKLAAVINGLLSAPEELKSMGRVARSLGKAGAAAQILENCREIIARKKAA